MPAIAPTSTASASTLSTSASTSDISESASRTEPSPSAFEVHELAPGQVAGIGQVISFRASEGSPERGLAGKLGFRVPEPGEIGRHNGGIDRVAELVPGAGAACPALPVPVAWAHRQLSVAMAFEVDTNGMVDRGTLQVIESPNRPLTEHRFRSHIYVVGAKVQPKTGPVDAATYDSVLTHEVASHVSDLMFRPALKEGRTVRSTVLISCQTSEAK